MLETRDLILKIGAFEDWEDMYQNLWRHEECARYMLWSPIQTEEAAKRRMTATLEFQKSKNFEFLVYEKKNNQAIGFAGMEEVEHGVYEDTGIAIGPEFWGRGYGKQIVNALMKHAFEELGAARFVYSCRSQNGASKRLALACGFSWARKEERVDKRNGEPYVLEYYEICSRMLC